MLSEEERKQRKRLSQAKAKVKQFEAKIQRAELRAAYWRRRVADIEFEQKAIVQPPLWPIQEIPRKEETLPAITASESDLRSPALSTKDA